MSALSRIKVKGVRPAIAANGGIDGAAATLDKGRSWVGDWHNRNHAGMPTLPDAFALDEVALAETGRAPILQALAAELGHVAIRLPECDGCGDALVLAVVKAAGEFGDVANAITDALRDGVRTAAENAHIVEEIDQAQAQLARLRLMVTGVPVPVSGRSGEEDAA
ncbi:hypothetical protein GCM10022600_15170 [Qipengyuania pelagi]|uniref:Uncharacterized protein n=1 Tax=Qipengyuania pelagi TaxID=994320 RepID=A0A844Y9D5_9SPHN|nr:phage regulatory CII family protein [Qipengyuania pelagi]MXO53628.1 hypothetical protein [Qipengyuania pelagi]